MKQNIKTLQPLSVLTDNHSLEFCVKYFLLVLPLMFALFGSALGLSSKESSSNAGDLGWIPRSGRSPEEGNGNPL